jgi:dethiobiotin synthetase
MSRLIVVVGTGTGIGKTYVAAALVRAWGKRGLRIAGVKPIESGGTEDGDLLGRVSTFHVQRPTSPYVLARPVSPHLAARLEGQTIDLERVRRYVDDVRSQCDGVVVETAGGIFSPLAPPLTNAELVLSLAADAVLLVAPDRLGVLHDVAAVTRATKQLLTGIVLSAPAQPDASTGTNAAELTLVTDVPILSVFPRAPVDEISAAAVLDRLIG